VAAVLVAVVAGLDSTGLLDPWWSVLVDDVAQFLAPLAATLACWVTAARHHGGQRWWRIWMGAGACSWMFGQLAWTWYQLVQNVGVPSPSLADVGYLILPVFALAALITLAAGPSVQPVPRSAAGQSVMVLDGLVIVGALFVLSWVSVLRPIVDGGAATAVVYSVAIAYPLSDLLLTVIVVMLIGASSTTSRAQLAFLGAGLFCLAVSDAVFAYRVAVGAHSVPPVADIGFVAGFALIAVAARTPAGEAPGWTARPTPRWGRLLLPYFPVAAMAVALAVQRARGIELGIAGVLVATTVIGLLVVRQAITLVLSAGLVASRTRLVLATDEARRQLERNLHDGVQQRLIALALDIRRAEADLPPDETKLRGQLSAVVAGLNSAVDEVRELSRGVHPAILTQGGLRPALRALARRSPLPMEFDVHVDGRLPEPIEVAAYYVTAEALTNAAKYAHASVVFVGLDVRGGNLHLSVRDDGVGGADARRGSGLVGLTDRVEALGGTLAVESPPGHGTRLDVEFPLDRS
jgi:signal transduction histidine kinase